MIDFFLRLLRVCKRVSVSFAAYVCRYAAPRGAPTGAPALAISFSKTKTIIPSVDEKNVFAKFSRWRTAPLEAARRAAAPFYLELAMR